MSKGYIGVDLGTTGTKSILFDERGNVLGKGYKGYGLITPKEGYFEQNACDWYNAVGCTVKEAVKDFDGQVAGISFSAQGGSFILADIDKDGKIVPLTNALTWMDNRATEEVEELGDKAYSLAGLKLGAGSSLCRILWLKKHCPNEYSKTKIILTTSDYIYYMLIGKKVIDYTSAYMMDIFDGENLCWNDSLLELVGLNKNQLPKPISAGEYLGDCNDNFIKATGLKGKVKVYSGVHDQFAASLGLNYFGSNDLLISTGTTWVVFGKSDKNIDLNFFKMKHPVGGYGYFASAISSGTVLSWEKDLFSTDYDNLNVGVEKAPFDDKLLVYPFISGNGAYRGENNQSFSVHNVNFKHTKFDVVKATMEGVAFEIKYIIDTCREKGFKIGNIIITGGATRSNAWMQILSNVLGEKLYLSQQVDGCCFGAYSVAKKGDEGEYVTFEFDGNIIEPQSDLLKKYQEKYIAYNKGIKL